MGMQSTGILLFRRRGDALEVFLVHPGGPFWLKRDEGAWSIPKGLFEAGEEPLTAAKREFREETGFVPQGRFIELGRLKQGGGKVVHAWALEMDVDERRLESNTFSMEWPKGSGVIRAFPEVDRGAWFGLEQARKRLVKGQVGFIDRLLARLRPET